MRQRLVLGGVASALVLSFAPQPASANHIMACEEGFERICWAVAIVELFVCQPRPVPC
jgi:hypothetical protein